MIFTTQSLIRLKLSAEEADATYLSVNMKRVEILTIGLNHDKECEERAYLLGCCSGVLNEIQRHFRKLEMGKSVTFRFRIPEIYGIERSMIDSTLIGKSIVRKFTKEKVDTFNHQEWLDLVSGIRIKASTELKNYPHFYEDGEFDYEGEGI